MTAPHDCVCCGIALVQAARFCHSCGQPTGVAESESAVVAPFAVAASARHSVASRTGGGERRFATCLFADLSDYSAICGAFDPQRVPC